jgi:hypothetical protein
MGLSDEQIQALLLPKPRQHKPSGYVYPGKKYAPPVQLGPLRVHDREQRCASRGCGSPTYYTFDYVPRCSVHVLWIMSEIIREQRGGEGIENHAPEELNPRHRVNLQITCKCYDKERDNATSEV